MSLLAYVAALVVFVALDAVWLVVMGPSYRAVLGDMLSADIRWGPAVLFYLVDILGLMVFVIRPGQRHGAFWVLLHGLLFGLFTYAAVDLTNAAVLKNWTASLAAEDILWGMAVSAIAALIGWSVLRDRGRRRR